MFKVTDDMKCVGMLRGGWDLMEDEDFLYLVAGDEVVASFSVHIGLEQLKWAIKVIEEKYKYMLAK